MNNSLNNPKKPQLLSERLSQLKSTSSSCSGASLLEIEKRVASQGFRRIAGIDEAGRGPLAGPVVAAACVLNHTRLFSGINDSKLLTSKRRRALFQELTQCPGFNYAVGIVDADEIDRINILQATLRAMREAVLSLSERPDYLLVDGNIEIFIEKIPVHAVVRGDQRSQIIAAASILAKEFRDELMLNYDVQYPEYGFKEHKGYGTHRHRQALAKYGPCPIHRKTFSPLREYL